MRSRNKKGFTLVELLAVIVILAIILAIAVPSISKMIASSTRSAFESDAKLVLKTATLKALENDSFDPTSINETNIKTVLNIDNSKYSSLTIKKVNGELYVTIVGKDKWNNLTASGTQKQLNVSDTVAVNYVRGSNAPVLAPGMTPIKWNGSSWVNTTESDTAWYNYDTTNKIWANAKTADGSMWVWIPRYIYKISSGWHTSTAGTIDIQFSKGIDDNWNKSVIGAINGDESANASNNKWTNHPAFTFGDVELTGIWVAKFEASAAEGVANGYTYDGLCPTAGDNVSTKTIKILPNVFSWRCQTIGNAFTASRNMETNSVYGWGTTGNNIDTHMMKNTEWGAVAYLSKSSYGQGTSEIWINNANNYTTGCAANSVNQGASTTGCLNTYETTNGVKASTTGNIYGIYDMSGSAWERLSAYVDNGHSYLTSQGSSIINADNKYKDTYPKGITDNEASNYVLFINKSGDALYETSTLGTGTTSWFGDYSYAPNTSVPWFVRGGDFGNGTIAGTFNFGYTYGGAYSHYGFRPVLSVGAGL